MNSVVRDIVIFAVGAGVGAGITALVITKKIIKREQKRADEKIKSHEEYVQRLEEQLKTAESAILNGYKGENSNENEEKGEEKAIGSGKIGKKEEKSDRREGKPPVVDYTAFYNGPESSESPSERAGEELEMALDDPNETMNDQKIRTQAPKVITKSEYDDPEWEFHEKVTLNYYSGDGVLTDETNEIVDNIYLVVGETLERSGFNKNKSKIIYVRNFRLSTDYEICKVFESFYDN